MSKTLSRISPPPIGRVVREFLKTCSKPRNLMMDRVTEGWNLQQGINIQNQQGPNNTYRMLGAIRKQVIQCRNARGFFTWESRLDGHLPG